MHPSGRPRRQLSPECSGDPAFGSKAADGSTASAQMTYRLESFIHPYAVKAGRQDVGAWAKLDRKGGKKAWNVIKTLKSAGDFQSFVGIQVQR